MNKTSTSETLTPESAKAGEKVEGVLAIIHNGAPRSDHERLWLAQLFKTLAPGADGPTVRTVGHHIIGDVAGADVRHRSGAQSTWLHRWAVTLMERGECHVASGASDH